MTEIDKALYLPTPKIEEFAEIFRHYHDGEIGKVEFYRSGQEADQTE
jgi:hypothetical protein